MNLSKIIDLINSENYVKAEIELKPLLEQYPDSFDINKLMGVSLLAQKKFNRAVPHFENCYNIKEGDYDILLNLSFVFLKVQFYEKAIEFAQKAMDVDNSKPGSFQNLASCHLFLNNFDIAKNYAKKAIELRGGFKSKYLLGISDLLVLYADILLANKEYDEFVSYCLQTLELCYDSDIIVRLLRHDRKLVSDKILKTINNVIINAEKISNKIIRNEFISSAHFILGEYYAKVDQEKSEHHYVVANQYIADMQRQSIFNRQKICRAIINTFKNFDSSEILKNIDPDKGKGLVFILGMPRSGTTLTESIISTADSVCAGGEKSFFSLQLSNEIKSIVKQKNLDLSIDFFNSLGDRYLDHIKIQRNQNLFFTDKLPENYLYYKFIKLALPSAKFINCFRDPWDNAISLFKQNYSTNIFYASSFFGIASEYANYQKIIKFWRDTEGENFALNVEYEKLVTETGVIAKNIWEHCGLSGEYSEQKRKNHFGYTASMQQVTREIFTTSLKKEEFLAKKEEFYDNLKNQQGFWQKIDLN